MQENQQLTIACPECGGLIRENEQKWQCSRCQFSVSGFRQGRRLTAEEVEREVTNISNEITTARKGHSGKANRAATTDGSCSADRSEETGGPRTGGRRQKFALARECKPLLDAATKDLFRNNAFRITGLAVDATARDISKHVEKLKIQAELGQGTQAQTSAFPLNPAPTLDHIRDAADRLKDPEKRLIDEFFWFWPQEPGKSQSEPAMQALLRGNSQGAFDIWLERQNDPVDGVIAAHNLAIVYHMCALDWDSYAVEHEVAAERQQKIADYWQGAFKRWERLVVDDGFWERVTSRIRQLDDPCLTTGFARRMRHSVPKALDKINAEWALAYADADNIDLARVHIQYMCQTNQGSDNVEKTAELVLAPRKARLREQIQRAREAKDADLANAHEAVRVLIEHAKALLDVFDLFFGEQEHAQKELFDEVATT